MPERKYSFSFCALQTERCKQHQRQDPVKHQQHQRKRCHLATSSTTVSHEQTQQLSEDVKDRRLQHDEEAHRLACLILTGEQKNKDMIQLPDNNMS